MGIADRASDSLIEAWNAARIPTDHHSLIQQMTTAVGVDER